MTSETPDQAYVWAHLPESADPVVLGLVREHAGLVRFTYARSYLERDDAVPLFGVPDTRTLPGRRVEAPAIGHLADSLPDGWGQLVINRALGRDATTIDYMLRSSSDRFGALDFQQSPEHYMTRDTAATTDDMAVATELVERGATPTGILADAFLTGSSMGGARPKFTYRDVQGSWIAKMPRRADPYPVVRFEWVTMQLAAHCGIDVAPTQLTTLAGRDVLLVRRFDRSDDGARHFTVSANTVCGPLEDLGRWSTYHDFAEHLSAADNHELFTRIAANIALGNTDDHARNHAAFWNGHTLDLTPAYDIDPCRSMGWDSNQAMEYAPGHRRSNLAELASVAPLYGVDPAHAHEIITRTCDAIKDHLDDLITEAELAPDDERLLRSRILNPGVLDGWHS